MSVNNVMQMIKENRVEYIDMHFSDMFGRVHHFTLPATILKEEFFNKGFAFDGSSIRAWQGIEKSDMLIKPDPATAFIDPFREKSTLCLFNDVFDPRTGEKYSRCPRSILACAVDLLKSEGIGDTVYMGPEPEFFVFDSVSYSSERNSAYYSLDSKEGIWNSGDPDSKGHKIRHKEGYFPVTPQDTLMDFRNEVMSYLISMGVKPQIHHHEVATSGQCEVGVEFDKAIYAADIVNKLKYAVKNTAYQYDMTATFMPKPIFEDNGSGMHVHTSIWKNGKNLFSGSEYAGLSQTALYAIGGVLKHGRAIQAFTNPTANSYRRLIPGYEAPVKLAYSATNRSAAVRIPYSEGENATRFEFRCPDSSGSPYLAFAAIIMACFDGIKNKIDPGKPSDTNLFDTKSKAYLEINSTCGSLEESLNELNKNRKWLTEGNVFSDTMLDAYIDFRKENEIEPLKLRPNPYEFELYYDV